MLEIKKAGSPEVLKVTKAAYKSHFEKNGWRPVKKTKTKTVGSRSAVEGIPVDKRIEALMVAPLSHWTPQDVKYFAEVKGIDLNGTRTAAEAKDRIKTYMDGLKK